MGSYLMVRLDYVIICNDELEAKIMRLIEMYMDDERRRLYQQLLNDPKSNITPDDMVEITKDVWAPISHRLFMNDLYNLVKSENTLKRAIKSLQDKKFIRSTQPTKQYEAPKYQINIEVVQAELNELAQLGKSGYQKLIPSKIDTIKKRYHQKLIPSGEQNLIPSTPTLSTPMVSKFDTNSIKVTEKNNTVEKNEDLSAVADSAPALSDHLTDASNEKSPIATSSQEQPKNENNNHSQLSSSDVDKQASNVEKPAQGVDQNGGVKPSSQPVEPVESMDQKHARAPKKPKDTSKQQEIDRIYLLFDATYSELYEEPHKAARTKKNTEAIETLINCNASDEAIRFVLRDIWEDDDKFWLKHRTITSVASQYSTRVFKMRGRTSNQTSAASGAVTSGPRPTALVSEEQAAKNRADRHARAEAKRAELIRQGKPVPGMSHIQKASGE
jgi:hypothetical protein